MKILDKHKRLHRVIGRYRLWWGFCPRCNSDAPGVDICFVCKEVAVKHPNGGSIYERNRRQQYPPSLETKAYWWYCWMHSGFDRMQREWERDEHWGNNK